MAINTKRPPVKETVGAQYVCFGNMLEGEFAGTYESDVEKSEVVKSVKITENSDSANVYASGGVYDTNDAVSTTDIEVETVAFPFGTLAKMRGETADVGGLVLRGGKKIRPYFAYGKVVKFKNGKVKYDWYPKCKLVENSDESATSEEKFSEQNDTIKIAAYPFDKDGNTCATVDSTMTEFPEGLTEEKFFAKPILTKEDLTAAVSSPGK